MDPGLLEAGGSARIRQPDRSGTPRSALDPSRRVSSEERHGRARSSWTRRRPRLKSGEARRCQRRPDGTRRYSAGSDLPDACRHRSDASPIGDDAERAAVRDASRQASRERSTCQASPERRHRPVEPSSGMSPARRTRWLRQTCPDAVICRIESRDAALGDAGWSVRRLLRAAPPPPQTVPAERRSEVLRGGLIRAADCRRGGRLRRAPTSWGSACRRAPALDGLALRGQVGSPSTQTGANA